MEVSIFCCILLSLVVLVELWAVWLYRQCLGVGNTADGLLHQVLLVGIRLHEDHRHNAWPGRFLHLLGLPLLDPRGVRLREHVPSTEDSRAWFFLVAFRPLRWCSQLHDQLCGRSPETGGPPVGRKVSGLGSASRSDPSGAQVSQWSETHQYSAGFRLLGTCPPFPLCTRADTGFLMVSASSLHEHHAIHIRDMACRPACPPYFSRRHQMPWEIRRVLGRVLPQGTL